MIKVLKLFLRLIFSRSVTIVCGTRIRRYSFSLCSGLIKRWRGTIINVSELFYLWSGNNAYTIPETESDRRALVQMLKTQNVPVCAGCTISKTPERIVLARQIVQNVPDFRGYYTVFSRRSRTLENVEIRGIVHGFLLVKIKIRNKRVNVHNVSTRTRNASLLFFCRVSRLLADCSS